MTEYVWGLDPSVSRMAFAFAPLPTGSIDVATLLVGSDAREGQRLGWLDRQLRIYARQQAERYPPAAVWVEQPSGKHRNLPLVYAVGAAQAALFETLRCPVWTIPSSTWKQRTVGAGNATKAQVAAWVAARGAEVDGQDQADAYASAAAGRAMVHAASWEAAA